MGKLFRQNCVELDKIAANVAKPAQLILQAGPVHQKCSFEDELQQEHRDARKDKEEEHACTR